MSLCQWVLVNIENLMASGLNWEQQRAGTIDSSVIPSTHWSDQSWLIYWGT